MKMEIGPVGTTSGSQPEDPSTSGSVKMADIRETLSERGSRYGSFIDQGRIEQNIKYAMHDSPNWAGLDPDMKSALEMIATKISRILKGDPNFHDSWHDIVGYAKLVADRLENA